MNKYDVGVDRIPFAMLSNTYLRNLNSQFNGSHWETGQKTKSPIRSSTENPIKHVHQNTRWARSWKNMAGPKHEIQCGPNAEKTLRAKAGKRIGRHIMHHHMVAAAFGGHHPFCGHLLFSRLLPAVFFRRLAHIVFRVFSPPCFFSFWPTLYFRASER